MKKRILTLLLLLALVLSACGAETVQTLEYRGMTFTLDRDNQTITQEGTVYQYEIEARGSRTWYIITYPDGATYTTTYSGVIGTSSGDSLYMKGQRLSGDVLVSVLRDNQPKQKEPAQYLLCLLLIGLGVFHIAAPRAVWYLLRGWYYHGAEPSDLSLAAARIGGAAFSIFGVVLLFL